MLKRPKGKRKSFAFTRVEYKDNKKVQFVYNSPELDSINSRLRSKEIALDTANSLAITLKNKLNDSNDNSTTLINKDNEKLVKKTLEEASTKSIKKLSLYNTKVDYDRILKLLNNHSIYSITKVELKEIIETCDYSLNVKNKLICRVNLLLKQVGRNFMLSKIKNNEHEDISYINEQELKSLIAHILNSETNDRQFIADGITILFYTGAREGELFSLEERHYNGEVHHISHQRQRDNSKSLPKNNRKRDIGIPKAAQESLSRWFNYPKELKEYYRMNLSRATKRFAMETFKDRSKHISNHDLRHSFAIWSLKQGASLTEISQVLGNSLPVCVKHYTGFSMKNEQIANLMKKLNRED